ncbi:Agamous-like MADS-box protein AGL61 [Platanthera guangdongensis]|uniref:Agamous-like MADS-box protein AGL61 n=1 Tax=Platanthera guangdongensis TaxID=2320717 RepID=A0ABR2MT00_9ASPA
MMMARKKRQSMGRQKIAMKRIEWEVSRQVCFLKRRAGLFKKATELSILCGAKISIVVFSPAGKPFSFGHPSLDHIIRRFFSGGSDAPPQLHGIRVDGDKMHHLNEEHTGNSYMGDANPEIGDPSQVSQLASRGLLQVPPVGRDQSSKDGRTYFFVRSGRTARAVSPF